MLSYYYIAINIITFIIWGIDKFKATQHQWRIPEKTFFALIIFGGAIGGLAGMSVFRHKTRKLYFWILGIVFVIVHAIIVFQFLTK